MQCRSFLPQCLDTTDSAATTRKAISQTFKQSDGRFGSAERLGIRPVIRRWLIEIQGFGPDSDVEEARIRVAGTSFTTLAHNALIDDIAQLPFDGAPGEFDGGIDIGQTDA